MTPREMFEKAFERPRNYTQLSPSEQWKIDEELGILDWDGSGLTEEDIKRLREYFSVD